MKKTYITPTMLTDSIIASLPLMVASITVDVDGKKAEIDLNDTENYDGTFGARRYELWKDDDENVAEF